MKIKIKEAEKYAARIRKSRDWRACWDDVKKLCALAGLDEDLALASGDEFESVIDEAADILDVQIY